MFKILLLLAFAGALSANVQSRCQNEPNGTQLPMPSSRNTYLLCLNGAENIRTCPSGREFDPFDRRCLSSNSETRSIPSRTTQDRCHGQPNGTLIPDTSSRTRFIECHNGASFSGECAQNQVFNSNTLACENQPRNPIARPTVTRPPVTRPPLNRPTTVRSNFSGNLRLTPRPQAASPMATSRVNIPPNNMRPIPRPLSGNADTSKLAPVNRPTAFKKLN